MTVCDTDIVMFGGGWNYPESAHLVADLQPWVYTLDTSKIDFDQQQPNNSALIRSLNESEDWMQAQHSTRHRDSVSLATEFTNVSEPQKITTSL
ncbi:hypothetical protein N7G274_010110 [Stereocaulon virgatum]|uniref:Uncharacterized protein n=1 Tax=Stereocaulon virgatum TaxID=373712 RepID=A0ABR3ZX68_9LECA